MGIGLYAVVRLTRNVVIETKHAKDDQVIELVLDLTGLNHDTSLGIEVE